MLENKKIIAVIQARGGSKGIPRKNIYPLSGHPLISYTISAAQASEYIDRLVVSTDCEEIANIAKLYGAEVPFLRPAHLAGDKVASVDSLHHAVIESETYFKEEYDYVIELPCVAPLRISDDIDGALRKLHRTRANSVISVVDTGEKHPVRLKRIVDDQITDFCEEYPEPAKGSRRQDLEPCFIRNGAIYSMTRSTLINDFSRHGSDSRPYAMPDERSINVDGWMDLRIVELMIRDGQCGNQPQKIDHHRTVSFARSKTPHILVTTPIHFMQEFKARVLADANTTVLSSEDVGADPKILLDVDGWVCSPCPEYVIDESILKHAKRLKTIVTPSTGSNHIDIAYCASVGIKVISMRESPVINSVYASSEFTFGLLMAVIRRLPQAFSGARQGLWRNVEDRYRGRELCGQTLGVIGFGRIGSNLAKYAQAFQMKVIMYDPNVSIDNPVIRQASGYEEVLGEADVLAVCVHLSSDTQGMVDSSWFNQMKKGSYFVNTSRGEVINELDLVAALSSGQIAAAGVDVISNEQTGNTSENPLIEYARKNDNLIVTPHIAGLTMESETKTATYAYDRVRAELDL